MDRETRKLSELKLGQHVLTVSNGVQPSNADWNLKYDPGDQARPEPAPGPIHDQFGLWLAMLIHYSSTIGMNQEQQEQLHKAINSL